MKNLAPNGSLDTHIAMSHHMVLKGTGHHMGPWGGQAEVGYQLGKQEACGPWGAQGRARIESRGPEDGIHTFGCVSGAKSSGPQLSA